MEEGTQFRQFNSHPQYCPDFPEAEGEDLGLTLLAYLRQGSWSSVPL